MGNRDILETHFRDSFSEKGLYSDPVGHPAYPSFLLQNLRHIWAWISGVKLMSVRSSECQRPRTSLGHLRRGFNSQFVIKNFVLLSPSRSADAS